MLGEPVHELHAQRVRARVSALRRETVRERVEEARAVPRLPHHARPAVQVRLPRCAVARS